MSLEVKIATLVLTKAFEKMGENLGEKVLEQAGKLLTVLRDKFPNTASAIELAQQQPLDIGQAHLISDVEAAGKNSPEVAEAIQVIASEAKQQLSRTVVEQVMASGIVTTGIVKAGDLTQTSTKPTIGVRQIMLSDVKAESIELGDLTQES